MKNILVKLYIPTVVFVNAQRVLILKNCMTILITIQMCLVLHNVMKILETSGEMFGVSEYYELQLTI